MRTRPGRRRPWPRNRRGGVAVAPGERHKPGLGRERPAPRQPARPRGDALDDVDAQRQAAEHPVADGGVELGRQRVVDGDREAAARRRDESRLPGVHRPQQRPGFEVAWPEQRLDVHRLGAEAHVETGERLAVAGREGANLALDGAPRDAPQRLAELVDEAAGGAAELGPARPHERRQCGVEVVREPTTHILAMKG